MASKIADSTHALYCIVREGGLYSILSFLCIFEALQVRSAAIAASNIADSTHALYCIVREGGLHDILSFLCFFEAL